MPRYTADDARKIVDSVERTSVYEIPRDMVPGLTDAQYEALQKSQKDRFYLWAGSWVLPPAKRIVADHTPKREYVIYMVTLGEPTVQQIRCSAKAHTIEEACQQTVDGHPRNWRIVRALRPKSRARDIAIHIPERFRTEHYMPWPHVKDEAAA